MINNLNVASRWAIEEGLPTYSQSGKEGVFRKLLDTWGVDLWLDPWIEADRYIDGFEIRGMGIYHHVLNFHRVKVSDEYFEFWIVQIDGRPWANVTKRAKFYVAKTQEIFGRRTILLESDQFIERFKVDDETSISFPIDNLHVLYQMQAWKFKESYANTDIDEVIVEATAPRTYRIVE